MPREERAKLREDEQRAAAACVGVSDLVFLGYADGMVEPTLALRRDLARVIRQVRPDVVLDPEPERNYERIFASHPDHLATGEATLRAVYPDASNPHAFPALLNDEGLKPHTVATVWSAAAARRGRRWSSTRPRRSTRSSRRWSPQEPGRRRRAARPHASRVGRHDREERGAPQGSPRRGVPGHRHRLSRPDCVRRRRSQRAQHVVQDAAVAEVVGLDLGCRSAAGPRTRRSSRRRGSRAP